MATAVLPTNGYLQPIYSVFVNEINMKQQWQTVSRGAIAVAGPFIDAHEIWLRVDADVTPAFVLSLMREAHFYYSLHGENWEKLGTFILHSRRQWITGFHYAISNLATVKLGGQTIVKCFQNASSWKNLAFQGTGLAVIEARQFYRKRLLVILWLNSV